MAAGGATWETAGVLETDAANSFTVVGGIAPYRPGWWKFTATARKLVTINLNGSTFTGSTKVLVTTVYSGDEDPASAVFVKHGPNGFVQFYTQPGVTYRVRARPADVADVNLVLTYGVNYSEADALPAKTAWKTALQDDPGNVLYISAGDLLTLNNGEFASAKPWYDDLIERVGPPGFVGPSGRDGDYMAQEVLGGDDPIGAVGCVWSHAKYGDQDVQSWNTSTTGAENDGPGVCRPLVAGAADVELNTGVSYSLSYSVPDPLLLSGHATAETSMISRGLWFLIARDNLAERGVLSLAGLDPVADGVPAAFADSAELEFEGPLELVQVEVTGDVSGRPAEGAVPEGDGITIVTNDAVLPGWVGDEWSDHWSKGFLGDLDDGTGRPHLLIDYHDGAPTYITLPGIESFADCTDYAAGEAPDTAVGICMAKVTSGATPALNTSASNGSDIAVRLTLRSPRYRWVYDGPVGPYPIRTLQRGKDGLIGSGTQTLRRGSVQRSLRTLGAQR